MVKNLYTQESLFKDLNLALCNKEKSVKELKMFTQLLSEALYQRVEKLPGKVYRRVNFSQKLAQLYKTNISKIIYYYNFTSTSRLLSVAQGFGPWVLEITLEQGKRDCVADVTGISTYPHEKEILIACNSGFRIDHVSMEKKRIYLTLADQAKCLQLLSFEYSTRINTLAPAHLA
jgi:hypothetical protein